MKMFDSRLSTIVGLFAAAAIADDLKARIAAETRARQAGVAVRPETKAPVEARGGR